MVQLAHHDTQNPANPHIAGQQKGFFLPSLEEDVPQGEAVSYRQVETLMTGAERESKASNDYLASLIEREGGRQSDSSRTRQRLALEHARKLHLSKAMGILNSAGLAKDAPEEVVRMLKDLHPSEPVPQAATAHGPGGMTLDAKRFEFINGSWVDVQIRRSKSGTATDQFGWGGKEFWWPLRQDDEVMTLLAEVVFRPLAAGYLP